MSSVEFITRRLLSCAVFPGHSLSATERTVRKRTAHLGYWDNDGPAAAATSAPLVGGSSVGWCCGRPRGLRVKKLDVLRHAAAARVPALYLSARDDELVLPSHAHALHATHGSESAGAGAGAGGSGPASDLLEFEGTHNTVRPPEAYTAALAFMRRAVEGRAQARAWRANSNAAAKVFGTNSVRNPLEQQQSVHTAESSISAL